MHIRDSARLGSAAVAFHTEKHHLVFSLGHSTMPVYIRDRVGATGDDVLSAAESLTQEYVRAEFAFAAFAASDETMLVFPEARRLETAFKSVHLWLRAYQDAVCAVLLEIRGERAGVYSSMSKALTRGKPLQVLLASEFPDYERWFMRWKMLRDQMKLGAHFRTVLEVDPPRISGISFAYPRRAATDIDEGFISLDSVIGGLEMSTKLTDLARAHVEGAEPDKAHQRVPP